MYTHVVVKSWIAAYSDPIQVLAGQPIILNGRKDIWDGYTWLWAKSLAGKEGWVPDCIVSKQVPATVTENYTAIELTCRKGQYLISENVMHGWVFCKDGNTKKGWVPKRNLAEI